jgi:curved DNA-binding protein CbpA
MAKADEPKRAPRKPVPAYFVTLGLTPPVTADQIKSAFRRKSFIVHPDHGGSEPAFIALRVDYEKALSYVTGGVL